MTVSPEQEIRDRLALLTLEEKVRLLTAPDFSGLHSEPKIGLERIVMSDGPAGVRGHDWDERDPSQNIPCPVALGATWDKDLVERMGMIMGHDAREKGVDIALAPCVNLQRSPHAGRFFEYVSEDPLLSGSLGAAYVKGLQKLGVAATVKHFVANDSETERQTVDVVVDERTLREVYMLPFEVMVRSADPWLIMSAYNLVNGVAMCESPLLRQVIKEEWGYSGYIMSDFLAAKPNVASAAGGLDLAMPWPRNGGWDDILIQAVRSGELDESVIDDKIVRLMRLALRCGELDGLPEKQPVPRRDRAQEAHDLRTGAAASMVLARNCKQVLPLDRATLESVAVIGPNALYGKAGGGGSAKVYPVHVVSPLEGIAEALAGSAEVRFAEGVRPFAWHPVARAPWLQQPDRDEDGVLVEFLGGDGSVLGSERRNTGEFAWIGHFGPRVEVSAVAWVRVRTRVVAQETGDHQLGVSGVGRSHFILDGKELMDDVLALAPDADITEGFSFPPQRMFTVSMEQGQSVDLEVRHEVGTFRPGSRLSMFQIRMATPFGSEDSELEKAVQVAAESDAAIVVLGNDLCADAEGLDRSDLRLPGRQDELVRRVAEVNPRTAVVVNAAAPVLLPWADEVPAVLLAWLPGQELGHALADVLFGYSEPGGRLPFTWPRHEIGLPSVKPADGKLCYEEGLFVGHRAYDRDDREPLYEFGHGLGYTTWEYLDVQASDGASLADESVSISARVRNTGTRAGRETVQVYLSKPDSAVERPVRWLAGFVIVSAEPGEEVVASVELDEAAFRHWASGGWETERGRYTVRVGRSSRDLRLTSDLHVG